jgi:hypothetical protein
VVVHRQLALSTFSVIAGDIEPAFRASPEYWPVMAWAETAGYVTVHVA